MCIIFMDEIDAIGGKFIDKALIQPSQFDWNVEIPNLDVEGRCQTLEARMNKVPKSGDVGLSVIARGTPGFSGADLANLINVVALKATINGQKDLPDKDETSFSRKQMLARLDVCIGGRVEEELVFWEGEFSKSDVPSVPLVDLSAGVERVASGVSSDFAQAPRLAREMVTKYGMSKAVGVVAHNYEDDGKLMSTETSLLVERMRDLLQTAYENAKRIHTTHQRELHTLAATFLERETMTAGEIKASLTQVKEQVNRSNIPLASPQPIISATTAAAANTAAAVAAAASAKTKSAAPAGT
uniref:Peptidase M41 domain-containing protein n=1 Tax=Physcomitrium patens TaxID=3218 RepID=A0A7I4AIJ4_PHYPA